jgi:hypothetical protein
MTHRTRAYVLFDTPRFYEDLERIRRLRRVKGVQLAEVVGITSARLLHSRPDNPTIDSLIPLAVWGGLELHAYISIAGNVAALTEPPPECPRTAYDFARFYADLEQVRAQRGMNWYQVWRSAPLGTPRDIGQRVAQCSIVTEQAVKALAAWANLESEDYRMPGTSSNHE